MPGVLRTRTATYVSSVRTFIPVPGTSVSSARATIPGVRVRLRKKTPGVRVRIRVRTTFVYLPGTSVSSVIRLP